MAFMVLHIRQYRCDESMTLKDSEPVRSLPDLQSRQSIAAAVRPKNSRFTHKPPLQVI
jgi:hypothetical protein